MHKQQMGLSNWACKQKENPKGGILATINKHIGYQR